MSDLSKNGEVSSPVQMLASERTYRYLATTRRNIGFSKCGEKCETCSLFEALELTESKAYKRHREIEGEARRQHQQLSKEKTEGLHFIVADKGSVKLVPKLNVDFSYYLPRLSLIPMTINAPQTLDSVTYWWMESEGGRRVSNILTSINRYIGGLPEEIRNLRLHMDNCGGENKAQYSVYQL